MTASSSAARHAVVRGDEVADEGGQRRGVAVGGVAQGIGEQAEGVRVVGGALEHLVDVEADELLGLAVEVIGRQRVDPRREIGDEGGAVGPAAHSVVAAHSSWKRAITASSSSAA